jgi:hypothetical protein
MGFYNIKGYKTQIAHHMINIGDKVWIFRCNFNTNRPCDKLDFCHLGPFSVIKQINDVVFCLELPPSMKIHPILHVSLFELYKESSIPSRFQVPHLSIEIEGQEEFEVLIQDSFEKSWSILFTGRDTTLVKGLKNLSPIFVMLQKCFKNFIADI